MTISQQYYSVWQYAIIKNNFMEQESDAKMKF